MSVSMTPKDAEETKEAAKQIGLLMEEKGYDRTTGLMALAFILNAAISDLDDNEHRRMVFDAVTSVIAGRVIIKEETNEQ